MSDLKKLIIGLGIGAMIIIGQQLLSKRENWILGSILPIGTFLFASGIFYFLEIEFSMRSLLPFIVLIVMQVSIWEEGRRKLKDKKKFELNKMKSIDL